MKKTELVLGLLILTFGVGLFILNREAADPTVSASPQKVAPTVAETEVPLPSLTFVQSSSTTNAAHRRTAKPKQPWQPQTNLSTNASTDLQDPDARDALAMVGLDGAADVYWLDAIFDTTLPDNERADLMEDLNEVGFDDPKNLTADDVPMILNRLELIDAVLPNADDFMTPHLIEAQKDLSNMMATATSR